MSKTVSVGLGILFRVILRSHGLLKDSLLSIHISFYSVTAKVKSSQISGHCSTSIELDTNCTASKTVVGHRQCFSLTEFYHNGSPKALGFDHADPESGADGGISSSLDKEKQGLVITRRVCFGIGLWPNHWRPQSFIPPRWTE